MARQSRKTSKRLRAAESRDKASTSSHAPRRIDVDRGLARGLIGLAIVAALFLVIHLDRFQENPARLLVDARPLGTLVVLLAAAAFLGVYYYTHRPKIIRSKSRLAVFGALCLIPVLVARICALSGASPHLVPMGAIVFIIALCHGTQVAGTTGFVLALLTGLALRHPDTFPIADPAAVTLLGGALVWTFGARRIRKRLWLFKIGFIAAAIQLWLAIGTELVLGDAPSQQGFWAAANGVITGALLTAVLPIIEYLFNVNTEISLLELSDLNQPLMRQLGLHAPGTYHHSLVVGSLAETAAEAVDADPLIARVGAYFHDIGKLQKPDYFSENEGAQGSRHSELSPSMSALIIGAHVKDGAEMAEESNLPRAIIDIIEQHHGTSLMEFFYHRSKGENGEAVSEQTFRYPGPKPRTREAAIILLADTVEAASRTLPEPSPARLESFVHKLAMKRLLDGQFDNCALTLSDLTRIERSFVRVLTAIFHSRVAYPTAQAEDDASPTPADGKAAPV
ncbi:MAG: HD family phosphohydrolase [bacterium]